MGGGSLCGDHSPLSDTPGGNSHMSIPRMRWGGRGETEERSFLLAFEHGGKGDMNEDYPFVIEGCSADGGVEAVEHFTSTLLKSEEQVYPASGPRSPRRGHA